MISLNIYGKFCQLPAPAEAFGYDEALLVKSTGNLILWLCSYVKCLFFLSADEQGKDVETERSFVCRMKCILNTSAGFFKVLVL